MSKKSIKMLTDLLGTTTNASNASAVTTITIPAHQNTQTWSTHAVGATGQTIGGGATSNWSYTPDPDLAKLKEELKIEIAEVKVCLLVEVESLNEKIGILMAMIENLSVRICNSCHARVEEGQVHVCLTEQAERQLAEEVVLDEVEKQLQTAMKTYAQYPE